MLELLTIVEATRTWIIKNERNIPEHAPGKYDSSEKNTRFSLKDSFPFCNVFMPSFDECITPIFYVHKVRYFSPAQTCPQMRCSQWARTSSRRSPNRRPAIIGLRMKNTGTQLRNSKNSDWKKVVKVSSFRLLAGPDDRREWKDELTIRASIVAEGDLSSPSWD